MKHQPLIQETIAQLANRFKPNASPSVSPFIHDGTDVDVLDQVPDIKKAIEQLLEKEYLERSEGERDLLVYLA